MADLPGRRTMTTDRNHPVRERRHQRAGGLGLGATGFGAPNPCLQPRPVPLTPAAGSGPSSGNVGRRTAGIACEPSGHRLACPLSPGWDTGSEYRTPWHPDPGHLPARSLRLGLDAAIGQAARPKLGQGSAYFDLRRDVYSVSQNCTNSSGQNFEGTCRTILVSSGATRSGKTCFWSVAPLGCWGKSFRKIRMSEQ